MNSPVNNEIKITGILKIRIIKETHHGTIDDRSCSVTHQDHFPGYRRCCSGIADDPSVATDATVLATMQFQGASTPTSDGHLVFTSAGQMADANANATGTAAWARFMSTATYNAGAGAQAAGIMDCSVGTTAAAVDDIQLNSVNIVAGGIVTLTSLTLDFAL